MKATGKPAASTLIDALVSHLRAQASTADGVAAPAVILWTDPDREFAKVIPILRAVMPELFVYGDFDPAQRTGPAIWLRCVVDRSVKVPDLRDDVVPVLHLPGVSRQMLISGEGCPEELAPLIDLLYRGALWRQRGGHDWTVLAFLTSPQTIGLDVARDASTRAALTNALREIAVASLEQLRRAGRLEAADFESFLTSDVTGDLLRWMGDPAGTKLRMGTERWTSFRGLCEKQFDLDPEKHGEIAAGERMGKAEGAWEIVWARFAEAPSAFPGIPELLRRCPQSLFTPDHWPQKNDKDEQRLNTALRDLEGVPHAASCDRVLELEAEHGSRRKTVWARLGLAPLAMALEHLAVLADAARRPLGGSTPTEIALAYEAGPWRADAAGWRVLQTVPAEHDETVREVVQQLAEPWLAESAEAFQTAWQRAAPQIRREDVEPPDGGCLLFVDGLRYDLGRFLGERLTGRECRVELSTRFAALPSVTATGKPAVTPIASSVAGGRIGVDFAPKFESGRSVEAGGLRAAVAAKGYQLLGGEILDWPERDDARGYCEFGDIDSLGHTLDAKLPRQLDDELDRLTERILRLLDAGWRSVRVVTDHGWLFLPQGLPRAELPKFLTESRWARCAVIAGESRVDVPRVSWHWDASQTVAVAPGIACFHKEPCYAHGGLSLQECLTPDLLVSRGGTRLVQAVVRSITWRGMRCLVDAQVHGDDVRADLRLHTANGLSVAQKVKVLDADGSANLVVADDAHEHEALVLVLLSRDGSILSQRDTRVGVSS